jgi:hypothetical protein
MAKARSSKNMKVKLLLLLSLLLFIWGCENTPENSPIDENSSDGYYEALYSETAPVIDGAADEVCWQNATWAEMNYLWKGLVSSSADFSGRYKITWDENKIYLLVEVTDDVIFNSSNEMTNYWMGDCVEVFIDEDQSGGNHQYSYNAFAYHVSYETGNAYDYSPRGTAQIYDHVKVEISQQDNTYLWEMAIEIYDDSYTDDGDNTPVVLTADKSLGFTLAYCDNDVNNYSRDAFIGSKSTHGVDNDEGYINADVFGGLLLK